MAERTIPLNELHRRTGDLVEEASASDEPMYITAHGRPAVVLLAYEAYEALLDRLEDLADLVSLRQAVGEPVRPYDEFLVECETERK